MRQVAPESLTSLGPSSFEHGTARTEAGHVRDFAETWEWLAPLLPRVPVTRVYDLAPIDFIGVPVWSAVTPLAKDLAVSMGKGATALAAKLSAVMEAIERVSAEALPPDRVVRGSYQDLAASGAVDPTAFNLPSDTSYRPDAVYSWTGAYDLIGRDHRLVPTDLVLNPASEGVTARIETNGLASGNSYAESVLHALYELIERDAVSEEDFYTAHHDPGFSPPRPLRIVDPATVPPGTARDFIEKLGDQRLVVRIQEIPSAIGVPVFGVVLIDDDFFGSAGESVTFGGYGADLDPRRALVRAITEACQAHSGVAGGARDVFESIHSKRRPAEQKRRSELYYGSPTLAFPRERSGCDDVLQGIEEVVGRLRAAGTEHCLVTEVTRPDLGVPVVRVLVPGLACSYGETSRTPTLRMLGSVV
ncbi:YcaO-like family protein [Kitasatospora sp. NPDC058162]|uniref:YcaO-like family protein n=1 Tax=Kitasatospora sp. NPDC058162 TaxID=3346362 RepID=UPI0036DA2E60